MKIKKLSERLMSLNAGIDYQHKLVDELCAIMSLKKKSDLEYRASLENVIGSLEIFIQSDNGFLTEIVKSYQSYLAVTCQNQNNLIEGYQNEILLFLENAKQDKISAEMSKKVEQFDYNINQCKEQIIHYKRLIRQNQQNFQLILTQAAVSAQTNSLDEVNKARLNQRCFNMQELKTFNQSKLQQQVDNLMELVFQYQSLSGQIDLYEAYYMEEKANQVYDNFMRSFVLQVSYNKSMEHDVLKILERVNENSSQYRKISFQNFRKKIKQNQGIKNSIWNAYKKWTLPQTELDISESYIDSKLRQKWKKVCKEYKQIGLQN